MPKADKTALHQIRDFDVGMGAAGSQEARYVGVYKELQSVYNLQKQDSRSPNIQDCFIIAIFYLTSSNLFHCLFASPNSCNEINEFDLLFSSLYTWEF